MKRGIQKSMIYSLAVVLASGCFRPTSDSNNTDGSGVLDPGTGTQGTSSSPTVSQGNKPVVGANPVAVEPRTEAKACTCDDVAIDKDGVKTQGNCVANVVVQPSEETISLFYGTISAKSNSATLNNPEAETAKCTVIIPIKVPYGLSISMNQFTVNGGVSFDPGVTGVDLFGTSPYATVRTSYQWDNQSLPGLDANELVFNGTAVVGGVNSNTAGFEKIDNLMTTDYTNNSAEKSFQVVKMAVTIELFANAWRNADGMLPDAFKTGTPVNGTNIDASVFLTLGKSAASVLSYSCSEEPQAANGAPTVNAGPNQNYYFYGLNGDSGALNSPHNLPFPNAGWNQEEGVDDIIRGTSVKDDGLPLNPGIAQCYWEQIKLTPNDCAIVWVDAVSSPVDGSQMGYGANPRFRVVEDGKDFCRGEIRVQMSCTDGLLTSTMLKTINIIR